jgi:SNF2 family DNA or RNA helicase
MTPMPSMIPMPTQAEDSVWLAGRRKAFLWSSPRTGKTGTAILAADLVLAKTILVVTTASGRGVWRAAFPAWSAIPRVVRVLGSDPSGQTDVGIVSWGQLAAIPGAIGARPDLIILDEHHRACNPEAQRTQHVFGTPLNDGAILNLRGAIVQRADRVWMLSGTPIPHDLGNIWIAMRALFPERLAATKKLPDVSTYGAFRDRYCIMGMKKLSNGQRIPIVLNGKNGDELRGRLEGTFLRRTQADVGIRPPRYEILPLIVSPADRREIMKVPNERKILAAAEAGKTHELEMELGRLRHVTGLIKARAVASAVKEEFENGLEKIVLAYWHRDVGDVLETLLQPHGVVRLDGSTLPHAREQVEKRFRSPANKVFLVQIEAGCEAIDLSPADELWVVEYATSPRQMDQISKRITNVGKDRNCFIRACAIEGSIDEKLQATLIRLWQSIMEVVGK